MSRGAFLSALFCAALKSFKKSARSRSYFPGLPFTQWSQTDHLFAFADV